jgi:hypothetical protein
MQKYILPIAAAVAFGMAAPAMAYDTGGVMSMQAAVDEAADMGLVSVSHTNFSATNGRSKAGIAKAATWKSISTPLRATCGASTGNPAVHAAT